MDRRYHLTFTIAGLTICFQTEQPIKLTDSFLPFCSELQPDYRVEFYEVPVLEIFPKQWVYEGISYVVASDGCSGFKRQFRDVKRDNRPYAIASYDWDNRNIQVEYLPGSQEFICESGNCFFHIAWEVLLMHEQRMMLHAACVDTPFGGILFSGPSGIGKSTQAELWQKFGDGRLINGDRTVIHQENGLWVAYGSPYAGSSRCYVNERCSIRAIVFLRQEQQCQLRRLGTAEGFHRIFAGLTVNSWDREFVSFACDFAEKMAIQIPVYELACTPDRDAVNILKMELRESVDQ